MRIIRHKLHNTKRHLSAKINAIKHLKNKIHRHRNNEVVVARLNTKLAYLLRMIKSHARVVKNLEAESHKKARVFRKVALIREV